MPTSNKGKSFVKPNALLVTLRTLFAYCLAPLGHSFAAVRPNRQPLAVPKASPGFTVIELVTALVIAGVLGTLAVPRYHSTVVNARRGEAKANLSHIASLQSVYRIEHDFSPFSGLSVGYVSTDAESCANNVTTPVNKGLRNALGFRPEGCDSLRYGYTTDSSGNAEAYGPSDAPDRWIYPDCAGSSVGTQCGQTQGDVVRIAANSTKADVCRDIIEFCPGGGTVPPPPTCPASCPCGCDPPGVCKSPCTCTCDPWSPSPPTEDSSSCTGQNTDITITQNRSCTGTCPPSTPVSQQVTVNVPGSKPCCTCSFPAAPTEDPTVCVGTDSDITQTEVCTGTSCPTPATRTVTVPGSKVCCDSTTETECTKGTTTVCCDNATRTCDNTVPACNIIPIGCNCTLWSPSPPVYGVCTTSDDLSQHCTTDTVQGTKAGTQTRTCTETPPGSNACVGVLESQVVDDNCQLQGTKDCDCANQSIQCPAPSLTGKPSWPTPSPAATFSQSSCCDCAPGYTGTPPNCTVNVCGDQGTNTCSAGNYWKEDKVLQAGQSASSANCCVVGCLDNSNCPDCESCISNTCRGLTSIQEGNPCADVRNVQCCIPGTIVSDVLDSSIPLTCNTSNECCPPSTNLPNTDGDTCTIACGCAGNLECAENPLTLGIGTCRVDDPCDSEPPVAPGIYCRDQGASPFFPVNKAGDGCCSADNDGRICKSTGEGYQCCDTLAGTGVTCPGVAPGKGCCASGLRCKDMSTDSTTDVFKCCLSDDPVPGANCTTTCGCGGGHYCRNVTSNGVTEDICCPTTLPGDGKSCAALPKCGCRESGSECKEVFDANDHSVKICCPDPLPNIEDDPCATACGCGRKNLNTQLWCDNSKHPAEGKGTCQVSCTLVQEGRSCSNSDLNTNCCVATTDCVTTGDGLQCCDEVTQGGWGSACPVGVPGDGGCCGIGLTCDNNNNLHKCCYLDGTSENQSCSNGCPCGQIRVGSRDYPLSCQPGAGTTCQVLNFNTPAPSFPQPDPPLKCLANRLTPEIVKIINTCAKPGNTLATLKYRNGLNPESSDPQTAYHSCNTLRDIFNPHNYWLSSVKYNVEVGEGSKKKTVTFRCRNALKQVFDAYRKNVDLGYDSSNPINYPDPTPFTIGIGTGETIEGSRGLDCDNNGCSGGNMCDDSSTTDPATEFCNPTAS